MTGSWRQRHAAMTPLFAETLSWSQSQSSTTTSQSTTTSATTDPGPMLRATQAELQFTPTQRGTSGGEQTPCTGTRITGLGVSYGRRRTNALCHHIFWSISRTIFDRLDHTRKCQGAHNGSRTSHTLHVVCARSFYSIMYLGGFHRGSTDILGSLRAFLWSQEH